MDLIKKLEKIILSQIISISLIKNQKVIKII